MPILLYSLSSSNVRSVALEVDALVSASPTVEVQPTDFPVEDGADITDHIILRNRGYEVEALVTDMPMEGGVQPGRWLAAWTRLGELAESATRLVLVLPVGEVQPVLLTSFRTVKDVSTASSLRFTASFRALRTASTVLVPALRRREPKTKPNQNLGQQTPTPADAATAAKARRKTLLLRVLQATGAVGE